MKLNVELLVLGMVSKAPIVNETRFNGRHGCPNCLVTDEMAQIKKFGCTDMGRMDLSGQTLKGRVH